MVLALSLSITLNPVVAVSLGLLGGSDGGSALLVGLDGVGGRDGGGSGNGADGQHGDDGEELHGEEVGGFV